MYTPTGSQYTCHEVQSLMLEVFSLCSDCTSTHHINWTVDQPRNIWSEQAVLLWIHKQSSASGCVVIKLHCLNDALCILSCCAVHAARSMLHLQSLNQRVKCATGLSPLQLAQSMSLQCLLQLLTYAPVISSQTMASSATDGDAGSWKPLCRNSGG